MIILGIDPGTAIVGWAVIKKEGQKISLLNCDAIITKKGTLEENRLLTIYNEFTAILKTYSPDVISVEQLFFATNVATAMTVAQARGIILLGSAQHAVPVISYTPLQVKKTITGDGRADKRQIQFMLPRLISIKNVPKLDDITDAIAIALTHAYTNRFK